MIYLIALLIWKIIVITFSINSRFHFGFIQIAGRIFMWWICVIVLIESYETFEIWIIFDITIRTQFAFNIFIATLLILPDAVTRWNAELFNVSAGIVVVIFYQIPPCIFLRLFSSVFQFSPPIRKPIANLKFFFNLVCFFNFKIFAHLNIGEAGFLC